MNLNKKSLLAVCGAALTIALSSCNSGMTTMDFLTDSDDASVYKDALGQFEKLLKEAEAPSVTNQDERYVRLAKAEAELLDSATMIPTTTRGGAYAVTRVAPRTVAYTYSGNDDYRLKNLVVTKPSSSKPAEQSLINKAERDELLALWEKAMKGEGEYNPAAYLTGKGYELADSHTLTWQTAPETLDILNTSAQADSESLVNVVEGLVEYNNLGKAQPTGPEEWTVSEDGKTYTFSVPANNPWVNNQGQVQSTYGNVSAQDYVTGFQHMLDCAAGLEWLVDGVVEGVSDYLSGKETDFSKVGFKAQDNKVVVTLVNPEPFFPTRLAYSMFSPLNKSFFESKGGKLGVKELAEAREGDGYVYGKLGEVSSVLYCGPFYIDTHTAKEKSGEIILKRNTNYYKNASTTLNQIKWVYDAGENPEQLFNSCMSGDFAGINLGEASGNLQRAKDKGIFDSKAYVTDTESTTFFGGVNLHRQTYGLPGKAVVTNKSKKQAEFWQKAVLNKNVRKAIVHSFDKAAYNAASVGEGLKNFSLRNMYTKPDFVVLENDVTVDGKEWKGGTQYGDICQYYLDQKEGNFIKVADGQDGWFNADKAKEYLKKGKEELAADGIKWDDKAFVEVVYYSQSVSNTAQANVWAEKMNKIFGGEGFGGKLIEAKTSEDFYAVGYRAANGAALGADFFYGSGWGPDYADPSTYLDTFKPNGDGYMTKVIGLW